MRKNVSSKMYIFFFLQKSLQKNVYKYYKPHIRGKIYWYVISKFWNVVSKFDMCFRYIDMWFRYIYMWFRYIDMWFQYIDMWFRYIDMWFRYNDMWFRYINIWFRYIAMWFRYINMWFHKTVLIISVHCSSLVVKVMPPGYQRLPSVINIYIWHLHLLTTIKITGSFQE